MTKGAEKHLVQARAYVERGEEFYRKAAEEIVAAQKADTTLSNREIGEWFGRSERWVRDVVRWSTSSESTPTPYAEQQGAVAQRHAKSVLAKGDPEAVREIVGELDPGRARLLTEALAESHPHALAVTARNHELESVGRAEAAQKKRAPGLVQGHGFYAVLADLFAAKKAYGRALDTVAELDLDAGEKDALAEATERIGLIHDWFGSFLTSGSRDFDRELAALLAEEA